MRHFLFEFITGGGLAGQALPPSLASEGELMLNALLHDLLAITTDIAVCRDARLARPDADVPCYPINAEEPELVLARLQPDDRVWLIAPETNNCLNDWAERFQQKQVRLILSDNETLRVCSSKLQTAKALASRSIPALHSVSEVAALPDSSSGYILKPDDGAGAEGLQFFHDKTRLGAFIDSYRPANPLLQPFAEGDHMSLSLLCFNGDAVLLGCNRQYIEQHEGQLSLSALGINECLADYDQLLPLAKRIAAKLPGLRGYIGVDLIKAQQDYRVVEINPRLTTSYVRLSESIQYNVAELIVRTFHEQRLPEVDISSASPVRIPV